MVFTDRFAAMLRDARMAKGFSQGDLARRINLTKGAVGHYETGKRMPSLETVSRIAYVLGVSFDDIIPKTTR